MDLKALKEALETKEGKELLASLLETETEKLKTKADELLADNKKLRDEKRDFTKRLDALEAEKRQADEDDATKKGDIEKVKATLKAEHDKAMQKLQGMLNQRVLDSDLSSALDEAKVHPDLKPAVIALLKTSHKHEVVEGDQGSPVAKFDGRAVKEFVTEWAGKEESKRYLAAASNGGGGSNGANDGGKANVKTMKRADFDKADATARHSFIKDGGKIVD